LPCEARPPPRQQAEYARTNLEAAQGQLALANRRVESLLYCMQTNQAHEQLLSYDLLGCRMTLDECPLRLRGPEHDYLMNQLVRRARPLRGNRGAVASLALSADGRRLYSVGQEAGKPGEIKVWDLGPGKKPSPCAPT
jgi:hypothetical protein